MKIITITLNPAFDVHCTAEHFEACHENLVYVSEKEAGGKGVNISRALTVNGIDNLALLAVGEENGADFCRELDRAGMKYNAITLPGRIRENITIHTKDAPETRISFAGFATDASLLTLFSEKLFEIIEKDDIVTFTGRVPDGIPMEDVRRFVTKIKQSGARVVIDSRSFTGEDLVLLDPWLIKPNEEEISVYLGREVKGFEDVIRGAKEFYRGGIANVMISLGAKGAMLMCKDGCYIAKAPKISPLSTIGAGDSSIGGFIAAAYKGADSKEMLRSAVAYGSAACLTSGTRPPKSEDVARLYDMVEVECV